MKRIEWLTKFNGVKKWLIGERLLGFSSSNFLLFNAILML